MNFSEKVFFKLSKISLPTEMIFLIIQMLRSSGYLNSTGWKRSLSGKMPQSKSGQPIPWFTFPFLDFLEEKDISELEVFEFGSGNSTLWFASRVKKITSVEHDKGFYNKILQIVPDNVKYIYQKNDNNYPLTIKRIGKEFDIVIIDGRQRVECTKIACEYLKDNGVIIFDNSKREKYKEAINFLLGKGFKYLNFFGLNSCGFNKTVTTVFYKSNNIFNI